MQGPLLPALRDQLVTIISGTVFVFVALMAWSIAAIRRRAGSRLFFWLGTWSGMFGTRLLMASPAVASTLPNRIQISLPLLISAITYLLLPVACLVWLELVLGSVRLFLKVVIALGLAIGVAGISFALLTGSSEKLIPYNNLLTITALLVLVMIVTVPQLARKFLALPNRTVVVVGTLVFALEALYFNFAHALHLRTNPITGSLGFAALLFSFGYVAVQRSLANERRLLSIENELTIAREIQASILPAGSPEFKSLRVAAAYRPMTAVAGDFYEFVCIDQDHAGFLIADVTGHGVPAALIAAMIKVAVQSLVSCAHDPPAVLRGLNRILATQRSTRLVSASYLWLDTENYTASYSAAGHPPLLLCREGQATRIESNGLLLGVFPDSDYPLCRMPIHAGDRFLLYTDGVTEPENAKGDSFGDHKLEQVISDNRTRSLSDLLDQLLSEIHHWQPPSTPHQDDITMVAIDVLPSR